MPVYELQCKSCNHAFEVLCKSYEDSFKEKCPQCGSADLNRVISKSSFILKGDGWTKRGNESGLKN